MNTLPLRRPAFGYAAAVIATVLLTVALSSVRDEVGLLNEGLLFLVLTLLVASVWGRNQGLFAAVLTNLSFNFFFIDPLYRFTVQEPRNVVALIIFLAVSVVGGSLLSSARAGAEEARRRQAETQVALTLSREMSGHTEPDEALEALCQVAVGAFAAPGAAVLTSVDGRWSVLAHSGTDVAARDPDIDERAAADRAVKDGRLQSLGRTGLSKSRARIVTPSTRPAAPAERSVALVPLRIGARVLGVLRLDGPIGDTPFRDHPEELLNAVAGEAALAVQRTELAKAAAHAEALREADELKSALLNAVSHDLRTPLASIIASAGSLQQTDVTWTEDERQEFAEAIEREAQRLNGLVGNLLDLSRIESGSLLPAKGFYDLSALIDEVVGRLRPITAGRTVRVIVPPDLAPVPLDYIEIAEVLTNLLENAAKYTPSGTEIEVRVDPQPDKIVVRVSDHGPGVPVDAIAHVFEPFYRASGTGVRGTGLGLAVAKGLVEAHGGEIRIENNTDGGATFSFTLPIDSAESSLGEGVSNP